MTEYGIKANNVHSSSFGCIMTDRQIGAPVKKAVLETVPGMDGFYDFTELFGSATYSDRTLSYTFTVTGQDVAENEQAASDIVGWLSGITDAEIYDDLVSGYHFKGTCSSVSVAASSAGRTQRITATFTCHPYKISNSGGGEVL